MVDRQALEIPVYSDEFRMKPLSDIQDSAFQPAARQLWTARIAKAAVALAALYSLMLAGFYYAMKQPPETFSRLMMHVGPLPFLLFPFETMWKQARGGTLQPGDSAPEFRLPLLDGSGSVELSSFRANRPVVLIFGSYT
jgi:hypothetical protein